ncbi:MAG: RNA pyrophosphohydrolase [Alphaproteobacteria bacterium]|nr:RNA pyrophosphohydrolase [Alphaproteobacteria bacterium]MDD9920311.1 RNA pyrophosphohydrolase [Alphaproteobacteria bacterium]
MNLDLTYSADLYRPNVGLCVVNEARQILSAKRTGKFAGMFQMPQGGIDENEDVLTAAYRELWEETGIEQAATRYQAMLGGWLAYDYPNGLPSERGHIGQQQKWVLLSYDGALPVSEKIPHHELHSFCWMPAQELLGKCADFRRPIYEQVFEGFGLLSCKNARS